MTTVVQQLDAQGPAVVQRISSQLGGLACSQDTVQNLVDALHGGKSVTLTTDAGGQTQTATFDASGAHLGYGEAYIALALAAEQLRNAGVTSCATPEQWKAVLLGGPLTTSTTTTTSASASNIQLPGIVTLHTQGQGWGQIAKSTNVRLGTILTGVDSGTSTSGSLAPTGFSSEDMSKGRKSDSNEKTEKASRDPDKDKAKHSDAWIDHSKRATDPDKSAVPTDDATNPEGSESQKGRPNDR